MKKWSTRFIEKSLECTVPTAEAVKSNARKAQKKIKLPKALWIEAHQAVQGKFSPTWNAETIFAAGLAVGWAEHEESVK